MGENHTHREWQQWIENRPMAVGPHGVRFRPAIGPKHFHKANSFWAALAGLGRRWVSQKGAPQGNAKPLNC